MEFPKPNDRVCFMGPTGSGKSFLARWLLRQYQNVIVVDPKGQWKWGTSDPRFRRKAKDLRQLSEQLQAVRGNGEPIIYIPPKEHLLKHNSHLLDEVAAKALKRGNTLLYYDELYYVASGSDFMERAPNFYFCITTGRSKGIGVWSSFQRPAFIPLAAVSESEYRYAFFLRQQKDRQRAEELIGPIEWELLRKYKHSFVFATDLYTSGPTRLSERNTKELINNARETRFDAGAK